MTIEVIDFDEFSGVQTLIEFDDVNPRKFHIHHRQDVQRIIESNKELQKHPEYKSDGIKGGMQHVARIPEIMVKYLQQQGINVYSRNDWPKLRKLLMDPAHKYLRPTLGDI